MTAASSDRATREKSHTIISLPVLTAIVLYAGTMVCTNSAGYAVDGADTAGYKFAGIAQAGVDNSDGASGDLEVELRRDGAWLFAASGLTQADVGKRVYLVDNQTVGLLATTTNDVFVGVITEVVSASACYVAIAPGSPLEGAVATDTISESTAAAGVTIDGVLAKDGGVVLADGAAVQADVISEKTAAAGVTIDGVLLKDGVNQGTLFVSNSFMSTEQTGTGAPQNVAHGLGAIPTMMWFSFTELDGNAADLAEGAHDATNLIVTVTTGQKFKAYALK